MQTYLDFEKGLAEIEGKAEELRTLARKNSEMNVDEEAAALDRKAATLLDDLYRNLDPWRKTLVARHPERPHCKDYIDALFSEWTPLAGDRNFADDHAVMGGLARFNDRPVMVIGHEKGNDTRSRIDRNFGMARPEGYRKAIRLMDLADRFGLPVITLVDTPGAYPGKGAEERGQAEAIARSTEKCLQIGVPIISVIIGEGGSGGAVAFATADRIAMLEHSIYSVISPEGCASILWKDAEKMKEAAEALRLTAQDLLTLGVIDRIVPEPKGGAQRDKPETIARVGAALGELLAELDGKKPDALRKARRKKFLDMGTKIDSSRDGRSGRGGLEPRLAHQPVRIALDHLLDQRHEVGHRQPRRDRLEEFHHRRARPAVPAPPAPEDAGIRRRRHAGVAEPLVEHPRADLERRPRPGRHPRPLRIDHQLPRLASPGRRGRPSPSSP